MYASIKFYDGILLFQLSNEIKHFSLMVLSGLEQLPINE